MSAEPEPLHSRRAEKTRTKTDRDRQLCRTDPDRLAGVGWSTLRRAAMQWPILIALRKRSPSSGPLLQQSSQIVRSFAYEVEGGKFEIFRLRSANTSLAPSIEWDGCPRGGITGGIRRVVGLAYETVESSANSKKGGSF